MKCNNKESALRYITARKNEVLREINCEREMYIQQYQKIKTIPEVRALVDEIVRILDTENYPLIKIERDGIIFQANFRDVVGQATIKYSSYGLNTPTGNQLPFMKFLCEEVYRRLGYDLHTQLTINVHGAREILGHKFNLPLDEDDSITANHGGFAFGKVTVCGRQVFDEIASQCNKYCSIDLFECDYGAHDYSRLPHNNPSIASVAPGFFSKGFVYELSYVEEVYPYNTYGVGISLFKSGQSSKPNSGVNW